MRIIHIIDYFHPQLGYQETFLPREQAKLGHEVYMVTSDRYSPVIYPANRELLGKRIKGAGFFEEEGIKVWRLKTLFEVPHAIWMRGLEQKIQELKPDIVIMHGIVNCQAIRVAQLKTRLSSLKLIYDDHMAFMASRSRLAVLYPVFKRLFSPLIQQTADALVAVADTSRAFMHQKYGIPLDRITVIPLGADDELFRFDPVARRKIRQQLSVATDEILFVYAGKIIPEKGPHLLVQAALKLMERYSHVKVLLLGNGPAEYLTAIKQEIAAANRRDKFIWHSAVPNRALAGFYAASDVAVWPRESSLSMLEAMAGGLPIIISDKSEVLERIRWHNGLSYIGDDPTDLARQMESLFDAGLREELGANGRKAIETELSWQVIARKFLEIVQ
ncbi:MAG: glycosyltransferase family 4 protein [Dehalococcoidales bacterium]|nr:glycosyltransferase family 4 protein [Dehalococcoidales bacterium]